MSTIDKMKKSFFLVLTILAVTGCTNRNSVKTNSPFNKIEAIEEKYQPLPLTEVKPQGWINEQIRKNLDGFVGRLDTLVPQLIRDDKIYGESRLTKKVKNKEVGALGDAGDWQVQFLWWNSETQSNWRDGYLRSAILLNDKQHLSNLQKYVDYILSTQDKDGYLGIYDKDLRYRFDNENGELWAKATLLRGLLAWYEQTKDQKILSAIERAAQNVIDNYPAFHSHPFYSKQPNVGGTSHGLMITDVFENLFRITGKETYREYCLFLYQDFSEQELNESAQYKKLMNDTLLLSSHGVHVYEHLRSVAAAYYASGNPQLKIALDKFLNKINDETTASGAGVGDEWIGGKKADATKRGYEYCSLQELMHSYLELLLKTGNNAFADQAETIFFNAAQGARHPSESCIAYLKSDNSYYMTGGLSGDNSNKKQTRYTYSPVHQEAAVCCVPNAGRIAPYYVQHMWMKHNQSLVASLLGPCVVTTTVNSHRVTITEKTNYPFENTIEFVVSADSEFDLKIRKPGWVTKFSVDTEYIEEDGYVVIRKNWKGSQSVKINFIPEIVERKDINHENYFTYGALVLASPLAAREEKTKTFAIPGFYNFKYSPKHLKTYWYAGYPVVAVQNNPLIFKTILLNDSTHQKETVELVPMGNTILRQVTFKDPPH